MIAQSIFSSIKDRSVLWDQYVKEAEIFDQELIGELSGDLDVLLIFVSTVPSKFSSNLRRCM